MRRGEKGLGANLGTERKRTSVGGVSGVTWHGTGKPDICGQGRGNVRMVGFEGKRCW